METALGEQLSGCVFDGLPGLQALGRQRPGAITCSATGPITRAEQCAGQSVADHLRPRGPHRWRRKVDVHPDAAVAQHVHQILGGDIAAGTRRETGSRQPADRGVQPGHTGVDRRPGAGQADPRVLWKCAPSGRSPTRGRTSPTSSVTRPGWRCRWCRRWRCGRRRVRRPRRPRRARAGAVWARRRAVPGGRDDHLDGGPGVVGDGGDVADLRRGFGAGPTDVGPAVVHRRPTPRIPGIGSPPRSRGAPLFGLATSAENSMSG